MKYLHKPIMPKEVIDLISPKKGGIYVDCTLGGGGHAKLIADEIGNTGKLIGIDQDTEALLAAKENLKDFGDQIQYIHGNFSNLQQICDDLKIPKVDGILIDLGVSSYQLDNPERGFSFREEFLNSKLDMRMDRTQSLDAYEVVNYYSPGRLVYVLFELGEEKFARQIVRKIVRERVEKHIETTGELIRIIEKATPPKYRYSKKPGQFASNTFRAIRMEVNDELDVIRRVLPQAVDLLAPDGRLVVITFQSLEDRIVKNIFRDLGTEKSISPISRENIPATVKMLTRKPVTPKMDEIEENPRSNCAKLRAVEKV